MFQQDKDKQNNKYLGVIKFNKLSKEKQKDNVST
jgi:hypothetical protein